MARTTANKVRAVIKVGASHNLSAYIAAAASIVTRLVNADVLDVIRAITDDEAEQVETWLAAHFYAHFNQQYSRKHTGQASAVFQGDTKMYLESTQYGQTAVMLDPTGLLAQWNKQAKDGPVTVGLIWLGTNSSNASDDSL